MRSPGNAGASFLSARRFRVTASQGAIGKRAEKLAVIYRCREGEARRDDRSD
jgi:hypothetical protein